MTALEMIRKRVEDLEDTYGKGHDHRGHWSADCRACAFRAGREWQLLAESLAEREVAPLADRP